MKTKQVLGVYDHEIDTFARVDPTVEHKMGINSTVWHETAHMHLTQRTDYALLVNLLFKVGKYNKKYVKSAYILQEEMIETQECVAVFLELVYHYINTGKESCLTQIHILKTENPTYYRYFQPLEFLIDGYDHIDPTQKGRVAFLLGCVALSTDINLIPKPLFSKPSMLKQFFKSHKQVLKINPDKRFKELVKVTKEILNDLEDPISFIDEVITTSNIIVSDKDIIYIPDFIRAVIQKDNNDKMRGILDNLITLTTSDEDLTQRVHPTTLKVFDSSNVDETVVVEKMSTEIGAITLSYISSYEEIPFVFMDINKRTNFGTVFKKENLFREISNYTHPLVVRASEYIENKSYFIKLNRPIYIYFDKPYVLTKGMINNLLNEDAVCRIIDYDSFNLVVIKISLIEDVFVLQPIMSFQLVHVLKDIKFGVLKAKLNENKDSNYDDIILKNEKDIIPFDIIVNSIMQVGGKGDIEALQSEYTNVIAQMNK